MIPEQAKHPEPMCFTLSGIQISGINFKNGDRFDKDLLNNTLKQFNLQNCLLMEEIPKYKWDNCGVFAEFNILGKNWNKELRYNIKCVASCSGLLLIYAVFVVPLILMLFK